MSASTNRKNRAAAIAAGTDRKTLARAEEARKAAKSRSKWIISTIAVLLAIALVIVLSCTPVLYKTTAVKVDNESYSAAEVRYFSSTSFYSFYQNYGSYASLFGLDTSYGIAGLSMQSCSMLGDGATWADYFAQQAVASLQQLTFLCDYAKQNGITLTDEDKASIDESMSALEEYAKASGVSVSKYVAAQFGTGVTKAVVRQCMEMSTLATRAYTVYTEGLNYSQDEITAEYAANADSWDTFSYLSFSIAAETEQVTGTDGTVTSEVTDATLTAAKNKAQQVADQYASAEGSTPEEKLNNAIALVLGEGSCTNNEGSSGSSISSNFSEYLKGSPVADKAVALDGTSGSYVVVFLERSSNDYNTANVRHILVKAETDESGNTTDETLAAAKARAEEILTEWKADPTEEHFAELANLYSEDTGSNTTGGLYEEIYKGEMVENFEAFCFGGHKAGDTDIVSSSYGYHVMYYVGEGRPYCDVLAENSLLSTAVNGWLEAGTAAQTVVSDTYGYRHFVVNN